MSDYISFVILVSLISVYWMKMSYHYKGLAVANAFYTDDWFKRVCEVHIKSTPHDSFRIYHFIRIIPPFFAFIPEVSKTFFLKINGILMAFYLLLYVWLKYFTLPSLL